MRNPPPRSGALLAAAADAGTGRLEWDAGQASWPELARRARSLAAGLARAGIGRGDTVAALLDGRASWVELLLAVDELGAALLPLNPRLTRRELGGIRSEGEACLLVSDGRQHRELAEAVAGDADRIAHQALDALRVCPLAQTPSLEGPAAFARDPTLVVIATSGTSGTPRCVELDRAALFASAKASSQVLGSPAGERWLACLPLFHIGGVAILVRSILAAGSVLLQPRFDARAVSEAIDRRGVTIVSLVPTTLARLLDHRDERPAPASLRCVLLGGAAAPAALLDRAAAADFPVALTYGLSEAASQVATRPPSRRSAAGASLPPLPGNRLRIVDADGREAAVGELGEIEVAGPTLMRGYRGRPEHTARALRDGWLATGDLGSVDASGGLRVFERRSDLIVAGGENIRPAEVEAVLCTHPDVAEAGVRGVEDTEYGQRPRAWLVLRADRDPADADLRRFCRERLAGYKIPIDFVRVTSLPRNATGKLLRRRLPAPSADLEKASR